MFLYMVFYDILGNKVLDRCVSYVPDSVVQLAKDLNPGDTEIHIVDLSGFPTIGNGIPSDSVTYRIIQVWDYVDSYGHRWEPCTFTRNYYTEMVKCIRYDPDTGDGYIDFDNNIIHLMKPWPKKTYEGVEHGTIPAGTYISINKGGGNVYINTTIRPLEINKWTDYSFIMRPNRFYKGAAYIRLASLTSGTALGKEVTPYIANINITQKDSMILDNTESEYYAGLMINGDTVRKFAKYK